MSKRIIKSIQLLLGLALIWLAYLMISIINFPIGNLSSSADVAIVLGAAVSHDKPSPVFTERINHAINLYHAENVKKLIFTGGIGETQTLAEATIARNYAVSKQVKEQDIYIETDSLTTKQNLINAKQIVNQENFKSALLVSDGLHLKRAMLMAKDLGFNIKPSATPTSRYKSLKTKLPFALREVYFYHHYRLFGE